MEQRNCNYCNITVLTRNWTRHTQSRKHLNRLQQEPLIAGVRAPPQFQNDYLNNENLLDKKINIDTLPEPIKPIKWKRKRKNPNEIIKQKYKRIRKEIIEQFDDLEKNYKEISPKVVKRQLEKLFYKIKTNRRNFIINDFENDDYIVKKSEEALEGCFLTLRVTPKHEIDNLDIFLNDIPNMLYETFKSLLVQKEGIKLQLYFMGEFHHRLQNEYDNKNLWSKNIRIINNAEIKNAIRNLLYEIKNIIDGWESNEAYWQLVRVLYIDFKLREYKPLRGSSYIATPKKISETKSTINIKNEDQKCFKYCIMYGLYNNEIAKNPQEMYHYKRLENKYPNKPDFSKLLFPVSLEDIKKFCKQNPDISINVYNLSERKEIKPLQTCIQDEKRKYHINLLLIENEDKSHYIYIKNLSRLISSQLNKKEHEKFICDTCFYYTSNEEKIKQHYEFCDYFHKNEKAIPVLPEKGQNILRFKNAEKSIPVPLIYYTDFESVIKKLEHEHFQSKHELCSYSFFALGTQSFYKTFQLYTGKNSKDTLNHYITTLKEETIKLDQELKDRLEKFKLPCLNYKENKEFKDAEECHFCKKQFTQKDPKVRDHCHITGKFRGAAHQSCNLKVRTSLEIKVVFHNGSNYDWKFIVRKLYKLTKEIKAIPFTDEKFLTFSIQIPETRIKLCFIDSFRFMSSSLDKLTQTLLKKKGEINNFKYTLEYFKQKYSTINQDEFKFIIQKGVMFYEYLDSFEKLHEEKPPSFESFYTSLKETDISEEDYQRFLKVWQLLNCKTIKDYLEVYLAVDVFILTDVFEEFRKTSFKYYKLDPAHYYSAPGLSWDAMLKHTQINLELLTDPDMLYFFMEGIRGGLSVITKRYIKANNKYMKNYDPTIESSYFVPVDANNLYGNAMSYKLPIKSFEWCSDDDIEYLNNNLMSIPDDNDVGYSLRVDLEYPKKLHDYHNDFPFFPEHKVITEDMLSPYQKKLMNKKLGSLSKTSKLIASLNDKDKIVVDYRTLKQAIKHGLKLKKIHSAIKYNQENWLKSYIDKNTELRTKAESDFEKDFFKLMNNSVYGKTIENVLKRQKIEFCTDRKKALKHISKINFKKETIFSKNLVAIHMNKEKIKFNKPIYVGFCVLEMSKWIMYKFAYEYVKPKWSGAVEICGGDTDSLFLYIKTEDVYQDIKPDVEQWFDTSNFSNNNKFGLPKMNAKVLGKFKIETEDKKGNKNADNIPTKFIGLRAKMYDIEMEVVKNNLMHYEYKHAQKGVPNHKKRSDIELFVDILINEKQNFVEFNRIGSKKLDVYTIKQKKVALSNFDDKRYILDDGISTLAHGHYRIRNFF